MKTPTGIRRLLVLAVAAVAGTALTACGTGANSGTAGGTGPSGRVALLLNRFNASRYEASDEPFFAQRLLADCPRCTVDYRNAEQDPNKQLSQAQDALDKGAKVLVVNAVDSKAAASIASLAKQRGVPVIAYDRLIIGAPLDYYVSFDNIKTGQVQGQALLTALGPNATTDSILWMNGPPADNNAVLMRGGAHQALDGKVKIAAEFTMPGPGWDTNAAKSGLLRVLPTLGGTRISAVYAPNDGTAGMTATVLRAAGYAAVPPSTGQDAEIAGLQRILAGDQYMTIYKAFRLEAEKAADLAYALLRGQHPQAPASTDNTAGQIPTFLLQPVAVTRDNLKDTVLKDGFVTVGALCAGSYADACRKAGIA